MERNGNPQFHTVVMPVGSCVEHWLLATEPTSDGRHTVQPSPTSESGAASTLGAYSDPQGYNWHIVPVTCADVL